MSDILDMDRMIHLSLLDGQARALVASSARLCETARQVHGMSRVATAALGRLMTLTAMLGATLKGARDSLTVSIQGGGPLGTLLAVGHSDGTVKACVDQPNIDLPRKNQKLDVGAAVGHDGKLTVVKDMGLREPYVGQVLLQTGEIGEDFAFYLTASEQTPSLVSVGVLTDAHVRAAGGIILQPMPGCSEAALQSLEMTAPLLTNLSDTLFRLGLDGAVTDLLSHLSPVKLEERMLRYECDCSRERIIRVLISLGREELLSMCEEQHGAEVECCFCDAKHRFTEEELRELLREATDS